MSAKVVNQGPLDLRVYRGIALAVWPLSTLTVH